MCICAYKCECVLRYECMCVSMQPCVYECSSMRVMRMCAKVIEWQQQCVRAAACVWCGWM